MAMNVGPGHGDADNGVVAGFVPNGFAALECALKASAIGQLRRGVDILDPARIKARRIAALGNIAPLVGGGPSHVTHSSAVRV